MRGPAGCGVVTRTAVTRRAAAATTRTGSPAGCPGRGGVELERRRSTPPNAAAGPSQAASTSNDAMSRSSALISTPIRWTAQSGARYLSA